MLSEPPTKHLESCSGEADLAKGWAYIEFLMIFRGEGLFGALKDLDVLPKKYYFKVMHVHIHVDSSFSVHIGSTSVLICLSIPINS